MSKRTEQIVKKLKQYSLPLIVALFVVGGIATLLATQAAVEHGSGNLKPIARSLVTTTPSTINLYPFSSDIVTINTAGWRDIETSPGVFNWDPVDNVINATVSRNPDAKFRLRIYAGREAPRWLNEISGPCVYITPDSINGATGCVPRFWKDSYLDRYDRFVHAMAAKYESNPRVIDIMNSACTTIFAEPFVLGSDSASSDRLWQAGLRTAGHRECLERSLAKMMRAFPTTRITVAGHDKWQMLEQGAGSAGNARRADSWPAERDLLNSWRATYGRHLVIEEHGLEPDDYCPPGQPLRSADSFYCWFASSPPPKGLQFTRPDDNMSAAADNGVRMGACFLEFAAFMGMSEDKRRSVHRQLIANCD